MSKWLMKIHHERLKKQKDVASHTSETGIDLPFKNLSDLGLIYLILRSLNFIIRAST